MGEEEKRVKMGDKNEGTRLKELPMSENRTRTSVMNTQKIITRHVLNRVQNVSCYVKQSKFMNASMR